jgi:hypothetical protein
MLERPPGDGPTTDNREDKDDKDNVIDFGEAKRRQPKKRDNHIFNTSAKLKLMVEEARAHPLGLYRLCFTDDFGEPIKLTWFHKEWADAILQNSKVMIEAPRGATKSSFAIALALWLIGHNPDIRIAIVCGNDANAAKRLAEIKSHIQHDPLYHLVFPDVALDEKQKNDSLNLNVKRNRHTKDYTLEARGVLSDGTGDRKDFLLFDDVCNYKNSVAEPATREKVTSKVRGDWLNTLAPRGARVLYIYTPWAAEDASAILKKETKAIWKQLYYCHGKPEINDRHHSIFPELFPRKWLQLKELEVGSFEYSRAYLCSLAGDGVQLVRPEWLRTYSRVDINPDLLNRSQVVLSIDPMGSKRDGGKRRREKDLDYIGISIFLVDLTPHPCGRRPSPNRVYLVDAYQVRLSTAQATQHISELYARWLPDHTLVEAQGAQSLHEWLVERHPHISPIPVTATISKRQRLESITPLLQDSRERLLFHPQTVQLDPQPFPIMLGGDNPTMAQARRTLRSQLLNFPTTHDDVADSFTHGLRYIRHHCLPYEGSPDGEANARTVEIGVRMVEL